MALFNCTECGKEISDKAPACINCGCPVEAMKVEKKVEYIDIQDLLASFKSRYPSSTKTQQQSYLMDVFRVDYNEYNTFSVTKEAVNNSLYHYSLSKKDNSMKYCFFDELYEYCNQDYDRIKSVLINEFGYSENSAEANITIGMSYIKRNSTNRELITTQPVIEQKSNANTFLCPVCNNIISTNAEMCPNCGEKFAKRCPKCNSTNVEKISGLQKGIGFGLVGVFAANTILNDYQCNICGNKFK